MVISLLFNQKEWYIPKHSFFVETVDIQYPLTEVLGIMLYVWSVMNRRTDYYVYMYLREDGTPYYVGKGKEDRAYSRNRVTHRPPDERIVFPYMNLTEEESFQKEKELIAKYGRKDKGTGILRNRTDGGDGASGRIFKHSEESKAKLREKRKFQIYTEETRKKLSEVIKKGYANGTRRKGMLGRKHTEEHKENMRQLFKGRIISEEQKIKISIANKGRKHPPEYGKRISEMNRNRKISDAAKKSMSDAQTKRWANTDDETRREIGRKISERQKGVPRTEEEKRKLSEWFTGSICINNGTINSRIRKGEEIPDGWTKGRLSYKK